MCILQGGYEMSESKITKDMVDNFNNLMIDMGSILRLKIKEPCYVNIVLVDDIFLPPGTLGCSYTVDPSAEFYTIMESFFAKKYGVTEISYNNTKTTFWCI